VSAPTSVLALLAERAATLGEGRLVCLDGPAGSGKTTLADAVAAGFDELHQQGAARVLHMDDLYPGWSGLPHVDEQLDGLLTPLGEGRPGSYRRYDWVAGEFAETVDVPPTPLLVLEGVGSGASRFAPLQTVLVWIEAPHDLRMRRGIARDGEALAPHWEQWAEDENDLFTREQTRERADLRVDGTVPY
jgi:uridine kinase